MQFFKLSCHSLIFPYIHSPQYFDFKSFNFSLLTEDQPLIHMLQPELCITHTVSCFSQNHVPSLLPLLCFDVILMFLLQRQAEYDLWPDLALNI